jgi:hypothetical protein
MCPHFGTMLGEPYHREDDTNSPCPAFGSPAQLKYAGGITSTRGLSRRIAVWLSRGDILIGCCVSFLW